MDTYNLQRFLDAQSLDYDSAIINNIYKSNYKY